VCVTTFTRRGEPARRPTWDAMRAVEGFSRLSEQHRAGVACRIGEFSLVTHRCDYQSDRLVDRQMGPVAMLVIRYLEIQSAHRATVPAPHGIIGTDEVEFLGEPSIILSL
jgi:hypothetical protein